MGSKRLPGKGKTGRGASTSSASRSRSAPRTRSPPRTRTVSSFCFFLSTQRMGNKNRLEESEMLRQAQHLALVLFLLLIEITTGNHDSFQTQANYY